MAEELVKIEQTRKVYTVTEITRNIKVILEDSFPTVWVEGEISNLKQPQSGHIYFDLKDQKSLLHCALFKGAQQNIKFNIENGLHTICFGRISVYEVSGQYQLYIEKLEPKGIGALQLAFEQLKSKLSKEGLFNEAHKKPIPPLPQRIGIITSPTGAAIRDILKILNQRFPNLHIIIYPVLVQGEGAKEQIAQAIKDFNILYNVDVLILARGGGSLEDLWAFNEEIVARAIYNSKLPVISAIGHEIDFTIADFVADLRSPTPSAAAMRVVPEKQELIKTINILRSRLAHALLNDVSLVKKHLDSLMARYAFRQPLNIVREYQQLIDDLTKGLGTNIEHIIEINKESLNVLIGKLEALSPLGILKRGYSITMKLPQGQIVKDAKFLKKNDRVETRLGKGKFISKVEEIE